MEITDGEEVPFYVTADIIPFLPITPVLIHIMQQEDSMAASRFNDAKEIILPPYIILNQ